MFFHLVYRKLSNPSHGIEYQLAYAATTTAAAAAAAAAVIVVVVASVGAVLKEKKWNQESTLWRCAFARAVLYPVYIQYIPGNNSYVML